MVEKLQTKMCPPEREARHREQKTQIEIFFKENESNHGCSKYLWAWKESAEKNVFGGASSIAEIKRKAAKKFPYSEVVLLPL